MGARVFEYQQESKKGEQEGLNVGTKGEIPGRERGRSKKNGIEDRKGEKGPGTKQK